MPHSACNCRCAMCDIWKGNKNLKQLTEDDIFSLLSSFKKFGTKQVVMSGGEALLNKSFFHFCDMLGSHNIKVSLLSTGLTIQSNASQLVRYVNDIIVSLDGHETLHNTIRNIPGAFQKLSEGVRAIKALNASYQITARTVIHKLNFRQWPAIIDAAKEIGLNQISFLPADVSSHAFNRELLWDENRQHEIMLSKEELAELKETINTIKTNYRQDIETRFIAESAEKLDKIYQYYSAFYGFNSFPYKQCNAPWVSTVIEADGTVRPCFFHDAIGNIRQQSLDEILNSSSSIQYRKSLNTNTNNTCIKCVCYLNIPPYASVS